MTDIEKLIITAIDLAKRFKHEYVTIEHLTAVILDDEGVRSMCHDIQADFEAIQVALIQYLQDECDEIKIQGDEEPDPKKTQMLERVFNRALTQALFQGKKAIDQLDLVLSILGEPKSTSFYFAESLGLTKPKVMTWMHDSFAEQFKDQYDDARYEAEAYYSQQQRKQGEQPQTHVEVLRQFCTNLCENASEFEDVIGRREELKDLVQTIARKKKSNAILVGPSGVGKTAIVQGLAKLITEGHVPDIIKGTTVWELDMTKLIAGTKYRGDFEERMKMLGDALVELDDIVLFIDEIHTVIGAGSTSGSLDAGNMLKPALSSGKLKVIGATTDEEYRKIFEKESALARRFTKLQVTEPTVQEAKEVLRQTIDHYESFHDVEILFESADLAVELSAQYIFNKKLPDKAFDIIDRAAAFNRILPEDERVSVIGLDEIRSEVARLTGIPKEHLGTAAEEASIKKHTEVKAFLDNTVFGQQQAIDKVSNAITVSLAGLKDPNKPVASYLFTGPTGVGKTELARRLAQAMSMKLSRFDMAEYQERHSVSKLIGSPPGYIGHGDGKAGDGLLITQLEDNPNCILLLDEVEKAHPDIMSVMLSLLDEGIITSSTGKKVSAKNAIIIMTSNLGAKDAAIKKVGFNDETYNSTAVDEAVNNYFAPEFRNRLDGVVKFNALKPENMARIVTKFLRQLEGYVEGRHIKIIWSSSLKLMLEQKGYDVAMGARPLARLINERVKLPLANFMMEHTTAKEIKISYEPASDKVNILPMNRVAAVEKDAAL
jgi:ATP-dependent Clp protease ATP-binding subunit ClpA